ncbi:MAG: hypothetical protein ABIH89_00375 [Elusimicrobiota bacterium]
MKFIRFTGIISLSLIFSAAGCGQKNLWDYSTPEAMYKTYRDQAKVLRLVADDRNYRRAIRCFTEEAGKWFEKNYDKIEIEKEEVYEKLYLSKKFAYVFGRGIVPAGPDPDQEVYEFSNITSDSAQLKVEGYEKNIELVKKGRNWQIVGLFGVNEKVSP